MDKKYLDLALRYALELPGVTAANIGPHDIKQLRQNIEWAKTRPPLSYQETRRLARVGRQLASEWGPHFGPPA